MRTLALAILALCAAVGLLLVPFGLPGLWIIAAGVIAAGWLTGFGSLGAGVIATAVGLALVGDMAEWWLGYRFARRYGGSQRAAWGALIGGLVGAGVGVPVPVVGSLVGAFAGSFVGAVLFEGVAGEPSTAVRAGVGALLGRVAGTAAKVTLGLAIAVVGIFALVRG
jgi:uncharacterized protein